jgi:exopolysaccharide biosynthesis polyprenyl glycosylphosphotransferase
MKKNSNFILKTCLLASDILMLLVAFTLAYLVRTRLDDRPFYFVSNIWETVAIIICLIPIWIIVLYISGLYKKSVFLYRPKSYGRLLICSVISVMMFVSCDFFVGLEIFPVRSVALYFVVINFALLVIGRGIVKGTYRLLLSHDIGQQDVVIVGSNEIAASLVNFFHNNKTYGYKVVGVVADSKFIPPHAQNLKFISLKAAIKHAQPDIVIQASNANTEYNYTLATEHHISYMFVPNEDVLLSQINEVEIVGTQPIIDVKLTKLVGPWRLVKRFLDVLLGVFLLILTTPIWLVVIIIMKIAEPHGAVFFRQKRLTRFNREFGIYKFRTHKMAFTGLSPEEAFAKMGQPELAKQYRANGDRLDSDPRVTPVGRFLRATSLDELPQMLNVIKGDISLVGPRALVPEEINQYEKKNIVLSVRSGLTGLAQVSGRRDISFDERRRLDTYYVQHWSLFLDLQILLKTVTHVLLRRGAK